MGLYLTPTGDAEGEDIQFGEVIWHPWYDCPAAESSSKAERAMIQRQDLFEFHAYVIEDDPLEVKRMEAALNDPGKARRWIFLQEARKWKRKDMKMRQKRIERKISAANKANVADAASDSGSDDDEGCEMEEETPGKRAKRDMPPPARPGPDKRPRFAANGNDLFGHGANDHRMSSSPASQSGAPRIRSPSVLNGQYGRMESLISDRGDDEESNAEYDPRPPQVVAARPDSFTHESSGVFVDSGPRNVQDDITTWGLAFVNGGSYARNATVESAHEESADERERSGMTAIERSQYWAEDRQNLGMSDDEAYDQAIRNSMAPEDRHDTPVSGEPSGFDTITQANT